MALWAGGRSPPALNYFLPRDGPPRPPPDGGGAIDKGGARLIDGRYELHGSRPSDSTSSALLHRGGEWRGRSNVSQRPTLRHPPHDLHLRGGPGRSGPAMNFTGPVPPLSFLWLVPIDLPLLLHRILGRRGGRPHISQSPAHPPPPPLIRWGACARGAWVFCYPGPSQLHLGERERPRLGESARGPPSATSLSR